MTTLTEATVIVLALIAASAGVIGMIAAVTELVLTRNQTRKERDRRHD